MKNPLTMNTPPWVAASKCRPVRLSVALAAAVLVFMASPAQAAPGDLLARVDLPVPGFGVSVGVDCDGNLFYTQGDANLYKMNASGALLATIPITDSVSGAALTMDEMAFDNGRKVFWAQQHGSNPIRVYKLDRTTGVATFAFTSATTSVGTFRDGIAYDASDDSLWISADVSTTIEHYRACDGGFINQITPKNSSGGNLTLISGVQVGVGDQLYLGRDGQVQIVRVRKSDGGFIAAFTSPGGVRDEGLECDSVNFAPKLALWSRDVENFLVAIEIEPGSCACQNPCPDPIVTCNDAGLCSAVVNFSSSGSNTTCSPGPGSVFPVGSTVVTCTTINPFCADIPPSTCTFTVTVNDCETPQMVCANITVCNDPGQCSAVVNYPASLATDNCGVTSLICNPPSGSSFPKGSTSVICTATDAAGNWTSCSFTVTVNDCEAPLVACRPAPNPADKKIPVAGKNPPSGQNPDGYYQVLAKDNCDPDPLIYILDTRSAFIAGPFHSGDVVKIRQNPGGTPSSVPGNDPIVAQIHLNGDALAVAADASGNVTSRANGCLMLIPPDPK